ncbi:MAG TPA: DUF1579 domain-containing protein [bacterium]|nr:DUF1579 domain-containing protein [bacterium]
MTTCPTRSSLFAAFVAFAAVAAQPVCAQDMPDMRPAAELAKLKPFVGNWQGRGTMDDPSGESMSWRAHGTYRWVLNDHFLREDFVIEFDGMPVPMVFRSYIGWDRENGRYVAAVCSNEGIARLNEVQLGDGGAMTVMMRGHEAGSPYFERHCSSVEGDEMSLTIDLLMVEGDAVRVIDSKLMRCDDAYDGDTDAKGWMGATPDENLVRLAKANGLYDVKGSVVMMPGQPPMNIHGTDLYESWFGGNVCHGQTNGFADGAPDEYVAHSFWSWDAHRRCLVTVFVSNMGEIGEMEARWVGEQLVSTTATVQMGMPLAQRFVMTCAADGHWRTGIGHSLMGAIDPFVSFKATYEKKGEKKGEKER